MLIYYIITQSEKIVNSRNKTKVLFLAFLRIVWYNKFNNVKEKEKNGV